ncbi:Anaerobic dimethyl sulfoxide reductase chain A [Cronobacter dublinensis 582]|nr:Anaerobic dimethyl sulfoxide reductase chain A [Cronobacter dublinensis 582]
MSNTDNPAGITRRTLVKSTALGGLALAAGGISLPFGLKQAASS